MNRTIAALLVLASLALVGAIAFFMWMPLPQPEPRPRRPAKANGEQKATSLEPSEVQSTSPAAESIVPILDFCPDFTLVDLDDRPFGLDHLVARPVVLAFVSPAGAADSPRRAALAEVQTLLKTADKDQGPLIVSVELADAMRTAEQRRAAAESFQADATVWKYLSGSAETLAKAFPEALPEDPSQPVGPKLVLVDPQGCVRGLYVYAQEGDRRVIRDDLTMVLQERAILQPNLVAPEWLKQRRQTQLESIKTLEVEHGFQFVDRVKESGIRFRHRIVDDAGRSLVTAHYDHGNGLVAADVDGDKRLDLYFINQVGPSELWRNKGDGTFENVTERAGVALPERIKVSAAFADVDNDGDADLFVTTVRGGNVLFVNDGTGKFEDVTSNSGLAYSGHSSSAEFFDYNRDGLLDLFVVNVGKYTTDRMASIVNDRFTGPDAKEYRYFQSNPDAFSAHLKPGRAESSKLYKNLGGGKFADVTDEAEIGDLGWTGDASPIDVNEDGWLDLYLVNMQGHDEYYENVEGKKFVRRSREVFPRTPWGSMGIKVFDFNNDGRFDLFLTDMHTDMAKDLDPFHEQEKIPEELFDPVQQATDGKHIRGNAFFVGQGGGRFDEQSDALGAETFWPWGLSVGDLNADGYDDAFITGSMNFPFRYSVNSLLLNDRGRRFVDSQFALGVEPRRGGRTAKPWFELDTIGRDAAHPVAEALRSRGAMTPRAVVWGALGSRSSILLDLDGDGDLDIVTSDFNSEPQVLVSDLAQKKPDLKWLAVSLRGTKSNRDGLGAIVRVKTGESVQMKRHDGQSGYLSQSAGPLYFGLGSHDHVDQLEIVWPSGETQQLDGPIPANKPLEVVEP